MKDETGPKSSTSKHNWPSSQAEHPISNCRTTSHFNRTMAGVMKHVTGYSINKTQTMDHEVTGHSGMLGSSAKAGSSAGALELPSATIYTPALEQGNHEFHLIPFFRSFFLSFLLHLILFSLFFSFLFVLSE